METIDYNGMKLEEFTSDKPVTFEPAKKMIVWNEGYLFDEMLVLYVNTRFHAVLSIDNDGHLETFDHCAEIPEKPAPRRGTWIEVAKWCATGNGLVYDTYRDKIDTGIMFKPENSNQPIDEIIKVRKWGDKEWHEPTVDYMGIEE